MKTCLVSSLNLCTHESLSILSCGPAPVLQLLIATAPIISPEHGVSIEMFFFQTLLMLTSRCGLARAESKVTAVIDLFTGYSLLILWTEQRRRVKTWNSTSSSSKQPSDFVGYLLLGRRREGYLLFNTVTVILLRWKHHVFAPRPMSHTLQVVSAPLLICMGICPLQKYCATLHAKLDIMLCKLCSIHHRFAAC